MTKVGMEVHFRFFLFAERKRTCFCAFFLVRLQRVQREGQLPFAGAGQSPNVCEYLFLAYLKQGKDAQRVPVGDPPPGGAR